MKRRWKVAGALLAILIASACYVLLVPVRTGYLRVVAFSRGPRTNDLGEIVHSVAISNRGPFVVIANAGIETRMTDGTFYYDLGSPQTLQPGAELTVSLNPDASPQSRMVVCCEKVCDVDWLSRATWLADVFVLKRGVVERIYMDKPNSEPR